MGKTSNERDIIDIYSDNLIVLILGSGPSGDADLWYYQMEFFPFSVLFFFPKILPVSSKALPTTLVILSAIFEAQSSASEAFQLSPRLSQRPLRPS